MADGQWPKNWANYHDAFNPGKFLAQCLRCKITYSGLDNPKTDADPCPSCTRDLSPSGAVLDVLHRHKVVSLLEAVAELEDEGFIVLKDDEVHGDGKGWDVRQIARELKEGLALLR